MNLYSLTLQTPTAINKSVIGSFSGNTKSQEIIVSKGKVLEIYRVGENEKLQLLHSQEVFGLIRTMAPFKLPGIKHDYLIVLSDSGRIVILKFDMEKKQFIKEHQETYGKSGARRIVPGQLIATDPCGRACMIGAVEKQKFVYVLNSENNKLTISSPLEFHKNHILCMDMVGLDTEFLNAQFACIEIDQGDPFNPDTPIHTGEIIKYLTIYQLELGMNNVNRLSTQVIDSSANMLIAVPAQGGPGGYCILCQDFLIYKNSKTEKRVRYPKRVGLSEDQKQMIVTYGYHKVKGVYFYLLQTELGDLFLLQFEQNKNNELETITLLYLDTIPVAVSLNILKKGYVFAPAEKGNHNFYKIFSLGDSEKGLIVQTNSNEFDKQVYFTPQKLTNLELLEEINNLSVISDLKVKDLTKEGTPQIYALCAAGTRSSIRILRHGLAVTTIGESALHGTPNGIWTIPEVADSRESKYICISYSNINSTTVLEVSDTILEIFNTGIDQKSASIFIQLLEDKSWVQVTSTSINHIVDKKIQRISLGGVKIVRATGNHRQIVVALQNNDIVYYELESSGELVERVRKAQDSEIVCLNVGNIPAGRQRCKFLAVGYSNHSVRIFSLDPDTLFQKLETQHLPNSASESVLLIEMDRDADTQQEIIDNNFFLFIGLVNGILLRATVDKISGKLSDLRKRFLGEKPVKCFPHQVAGTRAVLALSTRPWICYMFRNKYFNTPLSYDTLDYTSYFSSKICPEGIVATSNRNLRFLIPKNYGEFFNQTIIPTRYTPRKLLINKDYKQLVVIESDYRSYPYEEKENLKREIYSKYGEQGQQALKLEESQIGAMQAPEGKWASCIRIMNPFNQKTVKLIEMAPDEHPVSALITTFKHEGENQKIYNDNEQFLIIGAVKNLKLHPQRTFTEAMIYTFKLTSNGQDLLFIHKTELDDIPYSLQKWKGKLLAGVGHTLRAYELGIKKFLRKAELRELNSPVTKIKVKGDRIFCSEMKDSIQVFNYKPKEQTFFELADDILPRWISAFQVLDYRTVVGTDKFENMFVIRVPENADNDLEETAHQYKLRFEQGYLNGAPYKMDTICNFYTGEIITQIKKAKLGNNTSQVLVYGTSMGSIGAFYPFENKDDIDFFVHLELYMRNEAQPLCGREHISFRSYHGPCKSVIDGDLCEEFLKLHSSKQKAMSEELERTPQDVLKKIEEIRNQIL